MAHKNNGASTTVENMCDRRNSCYNPGEREGGREGEREIER